MSEFIDTDQKGAILSIALNRADRKNAITVAMYGALADALSKAAADSAVRVVLLHGKGGVFAAGNDLADFMSAPPGKGDEPVLRFLRELAHFEKPLIAAVEGVAVGIGTTMLLHCDLVYAAPDASFALPFVNLALVPEAASTYLLPRIAGWQRAAEWLMLGEPFGPEEARAAGMVNAIVPSDRLMPTAMAAAQKLTAKPQFALRQAKRLMKKNEYENIDRAMRDEARVFSQCLQSPEAKEAFAAFFEKRNPDFSRF